MLVDIVDIVGSNRRNDGFRSTKSVRKEKSVDKKKGDPNNTYRVMCCQIGAILSTDFIDPVLKSLQ
jgi:hypothetical protein